MGMAANIAPGIARKVHDLAAKSGWTNVKMSVQDMRSLSQFKDERFSHVITSFALVMLKEYEDLAKTATETYRWRGVCRDQSGW